MVICSSFEIFHLFVPTPLSETDATGADDINARIFTTACHQQVILLEDDAGNILVNKVPAIRVRVDEDSGKFGVIELSNADFGGLFTMARETDGKVKGI